ncbi:MAG TPA: hypothetical protein VGW36_09270 [Pyrinomonadaceae bacterium]|nr:hypothetical protein [Pyrinomonadaceae bacterium]
MFRNVIRFVVLSVSLAASANVFGLAGNPAASFRSRSLSSLVATAHFRRERKAAHPLWPGSRFTESDRQRALARGLEFIYKTSLDPKNFENFGSDYLWCFYSLSTAVRHDSLRRAARRMGIERAREWRRLHRVLPHNADANTIMDFAFGSDAADSLGLRDPQMKERIRRAARHHSPRSFFLFDPRREPPPADVPLECKVDRTQNLRGARACSVCKSPLEMRTRYDVWYDALITAYSGERYGVDFGADYLDVLKWLPSLRPYRGADIGRDAEFVDAIYAVTHVVYTLNNYNQSRLNPLLLPHEFNFLKNNIQEAIARNDFDMLGEIMDALRAFGLNSNDSEMRKAMEFYLTHQNPDGSWGKVDEKDIYLRYHPTWNAIAGLSEYNWPAGETLNNPQALLLLENWKRNNAVSH